MSNNEFTDAVDWNLVDPSKYTRDDIWKSVADLTYQEFVQKYNAILGEKNTSPMVFLRSFVRFFYWDLQNAKAGVVAPAFGDLHFDNFGFIDMKPKAHYVFNDFDDGGFAPVGLDALRYFVILKLAYPDIDPQDSLIDAYFDVVSGKTEPAELSDKDANDLFGEKEKIHQKAIDRFKKGVNLVEDPEMKAKIQTFFAEDSRVNKNYNVINVLKYVGKTTGGSAGYDRYWAHVEVQNWDFTNDIIEFKGMTQTPGTDVGKWPVVNFDNRVNWLIHTIWPSSATPHLDIQASVNNKPFWVRSKTNGKTAFVDDTVVLPVLAVQIGIVAKKHKAAWAGYDRRDWLKKNRDYLANRYAVVFNTLLNAFSHT